MEKDDSDWPSFHWKRMVEEDSRDEKKKGGEQEEIT
jgi:hypothetical protein